MFGEAKKFVWLELMGRKMRINLYKKTKQQNQNPKLRSDPKSEVLDRRGGTWLHQAAMMTVPTERGRVRQGAVSSESSWPVV